MSAALPAQTLPKLPLFAIVVLRLGHGTVPLTFLTRDGCAGSLLAIVIDPVRGVVLLHEFPTGWNLTGSGTVFPAVTVNGRVVLGDKKLPSFDEMPEITRLHWPWLV